MKQDCKKGVLFGKLDARLCRGDVKRVRVTGKSSVVTQSQCHVLAGALLRRHFKVALLSKTVKENLAAWD